MLHSMKSKTIILSIHPCHIEKIFSGEKIYEFRKIIPSDIQNIVVYATSPIKKIVAVLEVDKVLTDTPESIWKQTNKHSGITKDFFMSYFSGKEKANPIIAGTFGANQKVWHEKPISDAHGIIDTDLARDNLENDIPFADLQDL